MGAMFVVRDISSFYLAMRQTQSILILSLVGVLTLGMLLVLGLLSALVFRRLERIIEVATRVVGGDYDSQLFVQFRPVFVNVLAHVPELQEKH